MIKKGDLVMIVRALECCGDEEFLGMAFIAGDVEARPTICRLCGHADNLSVRTKNPVSGGWPRVDRLKKIDPPASGELKGVPVMKPVEVTA